MRDSPEAFAPPPMDLMDCFPAALLQLRDNGQIAHFNLAWAELMGAPGAERNVVDYVHQEDRRPGLCQLDGRCPPQARCRARDEGDLAHQILHAARSLLRFRIGGRRLQPTVTSKGAAVMHDHSL